MKIILYCSLHADVELTKAIEAAGHIVVASVLPSQDLLYSIAERTPHVLVAELGLVIANPQVMSNVLHLYPDLLVIHLDPGQGNWKEKLLEFLVRPRPMIQPRPYAVSDRVVCHDVELQKLASGKLRRPNCTSPNWQSECTRQEARFVSQLLTGRANHSAALHYHRCMEAQQAGLDLELGYRLVHGSYKALSWGRELSARWLGLLAHYIPGVDLDYLPSPMTPGPAIDFVHHSPTVEALHAMAVVIRFGVEIPIADEIKFMVGAIFKKQSESELFQLSIRLFGFAHLLQRVAEAQINLMNAWLDPSWAENTGDRTYRRHAATYRDFWRFPYIASPDPLRTIVAGFHAGTTYVVIPQEKSPILPNHFEN